MRAFFVVAVTALAFSCGKKDNDSSTKHFNPSKIEGTHFGLGPWSITIAGVKEEKDYAEISDDLGLTLQPLALPFRAIVNSRTGDTRMFWPSLKKDSCSDYRETSLPGEASGSIANGGYWFAKNDEAGNFLSYVANVRRYNVCLTLNITPEPGSAKFSSSDSDLIDYFTRFMETADFDRLRKVYKGNFNNRTFLYTVFSSDNYNETITEVNDTTRTYSTAPILTIDGQRNDVVSEAFFGDCQIDMFKNALADKKKQVLRISKPSDGIISKYSLELTTEPDGTFNRVAEGILSSTRTTDCLIVRYYLKTSVKDAATAENDQELDDLFLSALSEMLVSIVQ
jgi:hypothetical protein